MSSREAILQRLRRARPELVPHPGEVRFAGDASLECFRSSLEAAGGQLAECHRDDWADWIRQRYAAGRVYSDHPDIPSGAALADSRAAAAVDVAVCRGGFGVAENGAIWVDDPGPGPRSLLHLCQHLVLVLAREAIVANMHEAYARLEAPLPAYGIFIAGPSKTADIEQCLVIGAHGPRSLTVLTEE